MQAYKSLDWYNFFISGHVQRILYYDIQDTSVCILAAKVIPSQKVSDRKQWHHAWILVNKKGGYIVTAHCSCKAGVGEACSHIAAVLFKVEASRKLGLNDPAKTSLANVWNKYYREKVTPQPLKEMDFNRPLHGKVQRRRKQPPEPPVEMTDFEETEALRCLKRICPDACILTKDDSDTDTASDDEEMPPVLVREHKITSKDMTKEELLEECENVLKDFKVSAVQASNLEKMTRAQAQSILWRRQRVGRITASIVHDIKTLKDTTDPARCVAKVMRYDEKDLGHIGHIKYGLRNESKAKELYRDLAAKQHMQFELRDCGLVVDTTFPIFAAAPDGVRTCSCHGEGLIEIKCCSSHRNLNVCDIPAIDKDFYLEPDTLKLFSF